MVTCMGRCLRLGRLRARQLLAELAIVALQLLQLRALCRKLPVEVCVCCRCSAAHRSHTLVCFLQPCFRDLHLQLHRLQPSLGCRLPLQSLLQLLHDDALLPLSCLQACCSCLLLLLGQRCGDSGQQQQQRART